MVGFLEALPKDPPFLEVAAALITLFPRLLAAAVIDHFPNLPLVLREFLIVRLVPQFALVVSHFRPLF